MDASSSFLYCYDLLLEIFSQCSLKSADKSKTISKICNDVIYDPLFMQYHKRKTGAIYGYLFQTQYKYNYLSFVVTPDDLTTVSLDFLPQKSRILASSDQGIVCCITNNDSRNPRFYVCKLTTIQIQMLPNPKLRYTTHSVALAVVQSNPLRYKIVRLSSLPIRLWSQHQTYLCEIFDSKIWGWKQYEILLPLQTFVCQGPIFVSGRVHWLLFDNRILAFNLQDKTYTILTLPHVVVIDNEHKFHDVKLVKYKGKLGIICKKFGTDFEIWAQQNNKSRVWQKIKKINAEGVKKKEPCSGLHAVGLYSSNTVLLKGRDYMFYNFEDSSVSPVKFDHYVNDVFSFRLDLEPVDLRGGY